MVIKTATSIFGDFLGNVLKKDLVIAATRKSLFHRVFLSPKGWRILWLNGKEYFWFVICPRDSYVCRSNVGILPFGKSTILSFPERRNPQQFWYNCGYCVPEITKIEIIRVDFLAILDFWGVIVSILDHLAILVNFDRFWSILYNFTPFGSSSQS